MKTENKKQLDEDIKRMRNMTSEERRHYGRYINERVKNLKSKK